MPHWLPEFRAWVYPRAELAKPGKRQNMHRADHVWRLILPFMAVVLLAWLLTVAVSLL